MTSRCPTSEPEALASRWTTDTLKDAGFPKRHREGLTEMAGRGLERAKELMERLERDCLIVLAGPNGTGKTMMATFWGASFAQQSKARGRPPSLRYAKAHDLMEAIRDRYDRDGQVASAARELIKRLRSVRYLVIDEMSELAGSDWESRTLTNILDHRYDNRLSTVCITNDEPQQVAANLGRSVWSRLQETGGVISCKWDSYRKTS